MYEAIFGILWKLWLFVAEQIRLGCMCLVHRRRSIDGWDEERKEEREWGREGEREKEGMDR